MNVSLWVFLSPRWLILLIKPSIIQNSPWILSFLRLCSMGSAFTRDNKGQAEGSCGSDTSLLPCVAMLASGGSGLGVKGQQEDFLCLRQLGV